MANIAELERVFTFISDHPEQHDQTAWTCETGACLAGHAALMNGYTKKYVYGCVINGVVDGPDGQSADVGEVAMRILGLSGCEANVLFASTNTREKIGLMIKDLANGEDMGRRWRLDHDKNLTYWIRNDAQ